MRQCPVCGYKPKPDLHYRDESQKLLALHSERSQNSIRKVFRKVTKNIKSEAKDTVKLWKFLQKISKATTAEVERGIEAYLKGGYMYEGKGLNYLGSIILNMNVTGKVVSENERKRFGKLPRPRSLDD